MIFLTRIERRILKALNSNSIPKAWENICCEFSEDKARAAIETLEEKNYLTCHYADNKPWIINMHFKGYFYKEIVFNELKKFFLKSVITPIIIAFITAFITAKFF